MMRLFLPKSRIVVSQFFGFQTSRKLIFSRGSHKTSGSTMAQKKGALTVETLNMFKKSFESDPKNLLAMNACAKHDPLEICAQRSVLNSTSINVFSHKVDSEVKPITNQKSSGRCWLFAALNAIRVPFAKQYQLEEFEFSQNYLFFWDKIERANYILHIIVEVLRRGETVDGRLMAYLLNSPMGDGGQWHMLSNLVIRYGLLPKKLLPDTFCSEMSSRLNSILNAKLREYTKELVPMVQNGCSDEKIEEKILKYMGEIYGIVSICVGVPPETFKWEYYNKNKTFCSVGPITPLQFYTEYVKPVYDIENKVCLVNDPRPENPYDKTYTVDCLGNTWGGTRVIYINQEMDKLLKYASDSIKGNETVWFGCDVFKSFHKKTGTLSTDQFDHQMLLGVDLHLNLSKAERLSYWDSAMSHAMNLTGVTLDDKEEPTKWRVENSWGEDSGDKGFFLMTNKWFKEFGFEIVVDKQYLPKEVLDILEMEPKVLPAWDPMGSLAM